MVFRLLYVGKPDQLQSWTNSQHDVKDSLVVLTCAVAYLYKKCGVVRDSAWGTAQSHREQADGSRGKKEGWGLGGNVIIGLV